MSCVETETVVSSSGKSVGGDEGDVRHRKNTRIDDTLQLFAEKQPRPRRICRRHSYAFRCRDHEIDEDGDEGKHYESILFVRVRPMFCIR
jgi:hypothetical protein